MTGVHGRRHSPAVGMADMFAELGGCLVVRRAFLVRESGVLCPQLSGGGRLDRTKVRTVLVAV